MSAWRLVSHSTITGKSKQGRVRAKIARSVVLKMRRAGVQRTQQVRAPHKLNAVSRELGDELKRLAGVLER